VLTYLERYQPDAIRYALAANLPETSDTDMTEAELIRRNNDELVATWGNLVNRTLQSAYKNFGAVPTPGVLTPEDDALLSAMVRGFESVGALIEATRFRNALQEAMRLAALGNQYVAEQEPWVKLESDRERAATILFVALRTVDSLKVLLAPFLPFSAQRLHEALGYEDVLAGPLAFQTVAEDGEEHVVLTGDYSSWGGRWEPSELGAGQVLAKPAPLFAKLDPDAVVADELERMEAASAQ
jgi:methionyl-tRNA synthetase